MKTKLNLSFDPAYDGSWDEDSKMVLERFDELVGSMVLEVGANEEYTACVLADNGYHVITVDMRQQVFPKPINHCRIVGDFLSIAPMMTPNCFDAAYSTSALEHFGLCVYGQKEKVEDADTQSVRWMHTLLKPGGSCWITVPYGRELRDDGDWRVYHKASLQDRMIQDFEVVEKLFFKSGECICKSVGNIVAEEDAGQYSGTPPHVTVFLKMRKK